MLQQPEPGDYVIATGETNSQDEFVAETFSRLGLDWKEHVATDPYCCAPRKSWSADANPKMPTSCWVGGRSNI